MKADPSCPKGVARDPDPELDWECEQAYFERLKAKLARGARKRGVTLTRAESAVLLERFLAPPAPPKRTRGRPVNDRNRVIYMALNCVRLESKGMSPKNAVKEIADAYGVKRSTVYNARRKMIGNESN